MTTHETDAEAEAPDYDWSDKSAVWQIVHGELGDRTASAFTHLEVSINGGDAETLRFIGLDLLAAVEELRGIRAGE